MAGNFGAPKGTHKKKRMTPTLHCITKQKSGAQRNNTAKAKRMSLINATEI